MEISIVPIGVGISLSSYVAECVKIVQKSGVKYTITPMGTIVEGDIDTLLDLAKKMHRAPFLSGAKRVLTHIKLDERIDKEVAADDKVQSVLSKI